RRVVTRCDGHAGSFLAPQSAVALNPAGKHAPRASAVNLAGGIVNAKDKTVMCRMSQRRDSGVTALVSGTAPALVLRQLAQVEPQQDPLFEALARFLVA